MEKFGWVQVWMDFLRRVLFQERKKGLEIRLRGYEYDDWGELYANCTSESGKEEMVSVFNRGSSN